MINWLKQLENAHDVEILFACEAGSRAWGMESPTSDYDIRFIYIHKDLHRYLSIDPPKEVLEEGPFDAVGWDIMKACKLLRKSNPSLYEWCMSPIYYIDKHGFSEILKKIIKEGYSHYALFHHYESLCTRNLHEVKEKSYHEKRQKQLIYAVRSILIVQEMILKKELFFDFRMNEANLKENQLYQFYSDLLAAKDKQTLLSEKKVQDLVSLIEQEKQRLAHEAMTLAKGRDITVELNEWLWSLLGV
ncbi:DNA polymerase beta superfamily protein [Cytobacillus sp. Hz8]|uniref:nucleotidyltransferase domain-containing protein n=1 Tax=Cytobacillus sp. Hz8 TaxID=3347168 RepID=UPI0035D682B9